MCWRHIWMLMRNVDDHPSIFKLLLHLCQCDFFAQIQPCYLPFLYTSIIWLQILVSCVNIISLQIASIVFKRCLFFTTCIGLFMTICNKNKLCKNYIGIKGNPGHLQFVHFKTEDYKRVSMTWDRRRREMRRICVGLI